MPTITRAPNGGYYVAHSGDGWELKPQFFPSKTAAESFVNSLGFSEFVDRNASAIRSYEFSSTDREFDRFMRDNSSVCK